MSGQLKRPVETPREWLRYAAENLGVAEREMREETPAYHTICFLCQSAAEKFLKGHLIAQGSTSERTHDIAVLLELASGYDVGWRSLAEDGAVLNEYIVAGRYPGDIAFEEIGKAEAADRKRIFQQEYDAKPEQRNTPAQNQYPHRPGRHHRSRLCGPAPGRGPEPPLPGHRLRHFPAARR